MDVEEIQKRIQWLRGEDGVVQPPAAERVLAQVIEPLLSVEGYSLSGIQQERGFDWIARRPADETSLATTMAIEYKHYQRGRPLGRERVEQTLREAFRRGFDRVLVIARHGFSRSAREVALQDSPVAVELYTLDDLDAWVQRIQAGGASAPEQIQVLVRGLTHGLALLVARNPLSLDDIEWRFLELMVGRILSELGFAATVTPPSKDGGKDVIAECAVDDGRKSFIVELKHWRSGKRVGKGAVADFVEVIAKEKRDGGVFLSTSGYTDGAFGSLTEVVRQRVRMGGRQKIISLARNYERASAGLWSPPSNLPQLLFEGTE
jgi:restriction system protein